MNEYSADWIDLFLRDFDAQQTKREVDFLCRQLRLASHREVLDICCGFGRHSKTLADRGYEVTGIDRDANLIAEASMQCGNARFLVVDMRNLANLNQNFDAAICMWQSFGHFDAKTNVRILSEIGALLRTGGRFVLDIYHRGFFEARQGSREFNRNGRRVRETKSMNGDRLLVELFYDDSSRPVDRFEWQIFFPDDIAKLSVDAGLKVLAQCRDFDESLSPSTDVPRMQVVFER